MAAGSEDVDQSLTLERLKMTGNPFYLKAFAPCLQQPDELLWVLHQPGRMYEAVLRSYEGSPGWEVRIFRNGRFMAGYPFSTYASAREWATTKRDYIAFVDAFWADSQAAYPM